MSALPLVYLLFMYIGISFNLAGVMSIGIARTYGVDTAVIGYIFSLFTVGYSLAILANGFLLERLPVKLLMYAAIAVAFTGIAAATASGNIVFFAAAIFIAGVGLGVLCSNGNFYIVSFCHGKERTAKLNILNFFYGFGAILSPWAAGQLLKAGLTWQQVYQLSLVLLALLACQVAAVRFETAADKRECSQIQQAPGKWGAGIYLIGLGLFFYVVSEMIINYWIVIYLVESLGMPLATAGTALSLFWVFMAAGRLLSGMAANTINVVYLIPLCSLASFFLFGTVLLVKNMYAVLALTALLGLSYSGLYASLLSYGTMQAPHASAGLMTFFVTLGSAGGILAFLISSFLKQNFGIQSSLFLGVIAIGLVFVCVSAAAAKTGSGGRDG